MESQELIEAIEKLSVLELVELKKALEERWGVTAAASVVAAAAPIADAEAEEEKTEFEVILKEVGPNKIKVIKAVRELTSLGLRESKEVVDGAPSSVKKDVGKEEAAARAKLEEVGAVVEVK